MATTTFSKNQGGGVRQEPIVVHLTNERAGIVETVELPDLYALGHWLAEQNAEHHGRAGFLVPRGHEQLRCVIMRGGLTWGWRYLQERVAPLLERYRRLASRPRLQTPERFSEHTVNKAHHHAVQLAGDIRYDVVSGESGNHYTVTVRPGRRPRVQCTCPHGRWQARRNQDARCSHAVAVQNNQRSAPFGAVRA